MNSFTVLHPALRWDGTRLTILDQTVLPGEERWLTLERAADTADAIRRLAVRGAPLIGIVAAYGLAIEVAREPGLGALERGAETLVAALQATGAPFAAVDILPDPRIRQELSALSNWPTIPQLFVDGELVGGCDIVTEMFETGELHEVLGVERPAASEPADAPAGAEPAPRPLGVENRLG